MKPEGDDSEIDQIRHLMSGDTQAFEEIYRAHAANLYRYARRNISNKEDCEEIIQDIFESLWQRRNSLGHITALEPYLFRMVKYKVIRYFQHSKVKQRYADHYRLFEAIYENSPVDERDSDRYHAILEQGLAKLPERCRFAVRLRLMENLSNADIASRMQITKGTVENYMVTALRHLKEIKHDFY